MSNRFLLSIRSQMIILIVVLSLAPLGIIVFTALEKHGHEKQSAWLTAERLCNDIGNRQNVLLSGAEQLLSSLAYVPCIQKRDAASTTALISNLAKKNPNISNILISDTSGLVWASSLPMHGTVSVNDRRYFRNALETGNFSSGEYTLGRVLNRPVLSFGYPIKDDTGNILYVAIVAFTLDSYNQLLKMKKMPDKTSLVLTDYKGTILFDAGDPSFIGKKDKNDIFKQLLDGPDKGNFEAVGITGKHRYFAYQKLCMANEQAPYIYVRTGILKESLFSDNLVINVVIMVLFTLLGICFAVYTSKRGIIDKIVALRDAALQVGLGNLWVNVSESVSGGELGDLGHTFDEMSHRLADDMSSRKLIEDSLRISEAKYRSLVETSNEGVWVVDKERCTTFVNVRMAEILGYTPSEMLGREIGSFIAPDETENYAEQMTLRQQGKSSRFERRFQRKDGSFVCLLVSAAPLLDSDGLCKGSFAMIIDITERKQMEEDLFDSKLLLEKTVASLNESIFIVETGTRTILDCNATCEKMFGYSTNEMIGATTEFLHVSAEMSQRFGTEMLQAYAVKGFFETIFVMKRKDGAVFDSEHLVTPIRNELGEITRHVCVVRDLSETKQMQYKLEARNQFIESIFANLKSGIIVVKLDYSIVMFNQYVAEFSEEPAEEFVGRSLSEICPELQDALLTGSSVGEISVTLFHETHVIGFSKFDLNSVYMDSSGYIINFKDLTEDIKIRNELRHKERLSAMGEVVANVAHEMRNPLFAMTTVAQILEMELSLNPAQKELLDSLLKESRRLNDLVEELLDSTRALRLKRKSVDLNKIITDSFQVLQPISNNTKVGIRKKTYAESIPVFADSEKIEQVVINLVKNAIEASSEGSLVDLSIKRSHDGEVITVTDSGEGILPGTIDNIFEVFYTTKKHGTGLGLAICKNIIEAHGGTLEARNNEGRGATFTIKLPFGGDD